VQKQQKRNKSRRNYTVVVKYALLLEMRVREQNEFMQKKPDHLITVFAGVERCG
jgi:hypothetical protein